MNKRIKKKRLLKEVAELKKQNEQLVTQNLLLEEAQKQIHDRMNQIEKNAAINVEASNQNFDELRLKYNRLEKRVNQMKKPFWQRSK